MKNLELEHSLTSMTEEELESVNGGSVLKTIYWMVDHLDEIGRALNGALKNPPNLPSASAYK